jgi:hypothetical protein
MRSLLIALALVLTGGGLANAYPINVDHVDGYVYAAALNGNHGTVNNSDSRSFSTSPDIDSGWWSQSIQAEVVDPSNSQDGGTAIASSIGRTSDESVDISLDDFHAFYLFADWHSYLIVSFSSNASMQYDVGVYPGGIYFSGTTYNSYLLDGDTDLSTLRSNGAPDPSNVIIDASNYGDASSEEYTSGLLNPGSYYFVSQVYRSLSSKGGQSYQLKLTAVPVPEPGTVWLLIFGLIAFMSVRRKVMG